MSFPDVLKKMPHSGALRYPSHHLYVFFAASTRDYSLSLTSRSERGKEHWQPLLSRAEDHDGKLVVYGHVESAQEGNGYGY
jgi:hypothetical protein